MFMYEYFTEDGHKGSEEVSDVRAERLVGRRLMLGWATRSRVVETPSGRSIVVAWHESPEGRVWSLFHEGV